MIHTNSVAKQGLSLGSFFMHKSTKLSISSEKTFFGSRGGGWRMIIKLNFIQHYLGLFFIKYLIHNVL